MGEAWATLKGTVSFGSRVWGLGSLSNQCQHAQHVPTYRQAPANGCGRFELQFRQNFISLIPSSCVEQGPARPPCCSSHWCVLRETEGFSLCLPSVSLWRGHCLLLAVNTEHWADVPTSHGQVKFLKVRVFLFQSWKHILIDWYFALHVSLDRVECWL